MSLARQRKKGTRFSRLAVKRDLGGLYVSLNLRCQAEEQ